MTALRCFVTGGSGFLGAYVVRALLGEGFNVAVLHRSQVWPESLKGLEPKVLGLRGDLRDPAPWQSKMAAFTPDAVIHLAWHGVAGKFRNDPCQSANVEDTVRLASIALQQGVKHFIGAGSQAEYGPLTHIASETDPTHPTTLYGKAKCEAVKALEALTAHQPMRFAWLRIFSTYGPGEPSHWVLPSTIQDLLSGKSPALTKGEQLWDFLHAKDAAGAFLSVLKEEKASGILNLGSGEAPSLRSVLTYVRDLINPSLPLGFGQIPYRADQVMHLQADITRLTKLTGWKPTLSLDEGLRETVAWYAGRHKQ